MSNLLDKASIILTPTAYDTSEVLCVKPSDGTGDFDFSRATEATRINSLGLVETIGINLPRINYESGCGSWLFEPQSTNLYLNSETLSTQTITTTANQYTVSFYGTGTITFSGTHTGSLIGTGLNDRVTATFTATAGTLTSTVSGTVTNAQAEEQSYATSYIPTSGTQTTRNQDVCNNGGTGTGLINSTEGVLYADIKALAISNDQRRITLSNGTNTNRVVIFYNASNQLRGLVKVGNVNIFAPTKNIDITQTLKVALKWKENDFALWVNGVEEVVGLSGITFAADTLNTLDFADGNGIGNPYFGETKCLALWKEALTDKELQELTTI